MTCSTALKYQTVFKIVRTFWGNMIIDFPDEQVCYYTRVSNMKLHCQQLGGLS